MKELRIPPPRIFSRLGIPDMGLPHSKTLDQISSEQVNTSKFKHFPSSNWLRFIGIRYNLSIILMFNNISHLEIMENYIYCTNLTI
jgi:hypothetical protein